MADEDVKPRRGLLSKVFNWHTVIHAGLMSGMVFIGMAALSLTIATPLTLGDFFVQSGHAVINMVKGVAAQGPPMVAEIFNSAMSGDFAPTTFESGHVATADLLTPEQAIEFSAKAEDIGIPLEEYLEGWQLGH